MLLTQLFGGVEYRIPRIGEHSRLKCSIGIHWLTLVRQINNRLVVGVICSACDKEIKVHDIAVESR